MALIFGFDTETTGLVNNKLPPDHPSQPHLVQLGAVLMDDIEDRELATLAVIIQPDQWEVPVQASEVHGITTDMARASGVPLLVALAMFSNLSKLASVHIAHNVEFDLRVMGAAFSRINRRMADLNPLCTKNLARPIMKLPPTPKMVAAGFNKHKDPNLGEAIRFFFDEELSGAHDALVDVRACLRVYREIQRRGAGK